MQRNLSGHPESPLAAEDLAAHRSCGYILMRFARRNEQASYYPGNRLVERPWWSPQRQPALLFLIVGLALLVRIYLSVTSYCISGDGVAYLAMARHFEDGDWRAALSAVYSPLYPVLVCLMHRCVDWEMAGNLVSATLGTAAVATTYLMTREAFRSRYIASGAAALIALHPAAAAYSASVRTEAGYMFLTTSACWFLFKGLNERGIVWAASAGIAAGLGYLYRTEAIGFLPLGVTLFVMAGWLWKDLSHRWVLLAASSFAATFIMIAAPYIVYLRTVSGHWTIGREFGVAMMYGMGDVARNGGEWRQLGWSASVSPFRAILSNPQLYAEKVGDSVIVSIYSFVQALEPLLAVMLAIGIWVRSPVLRARARTLTTRSTRPFLWLPCSREIKTQPTASDSKRADCAGSVSINRLTETHTLSRRPQSVEGKRVFQAPIEEEGKRLPEAFLAIIVIFYFCGFALSYTGTRFMVHLLPFTLGWITAGIIFVSGKAVQWSKLTDRGIAQAIVPAAIAVSLLPRTLWPLGYDMRGVRYAGRDIAQMKKGAAAVAARDGRVAYYADARLIELPSSPPGDFCGWLRGQRGNFLMIGSRDEQLFDVARNQYCLELLKRYPRYGSGYYDLYAVFSVDQARNPSRATAAIATPSE